MRISTSSDSKWKSLLNRSSKKAVSNAELTRKAPATEPKSAVKPTPISNCSITKDYRLVDGVIGDGATSSVLRAVRKRDNTVFAVKVFSKPLRRDSIGAQRHLKKVVSEFWVGSTLRHDNIIKNIELIQDQGVWYHVMEYAPHNLLDRVCSDRMSLLEIDCCFAQICSAVAFVHQAGFAHRDIKLENVTYTDSGCMKLIDFGTVMHLGTGSDPDMDLAPTAHAGSLQYQAPELLSGSVYSPIKADVWSLGLLYTCMLLRRFPWKSATDTDAKFAAFKQNSGRLQTISEEQGMWDEKSNVTICVSDKASSSSDSDSVNSVADVAPDFLNQIAGPRRAVLRQILDVCYKSRPSVQQLLQEKFVVDVEVCTRLEAKDVQCCSHSHV